MKYQLVITNSAERSFRDLPKSVQVKIKEALIDMEINPFGGNALKLKGSNAFRRRVGNYRIIFNLDKGQIIIYIIDIRKRDEKTYRGL